MNKKNVSINDVASVSGVSKSTVSLVLRNSKNIKDSTKEKVMAAIAQTGYIYNLQAASMRVNKTKTIGLVFHDITNPFFALLAKKLQQKLFDYGYMLLMASSNDDGKMQYEIVQSMLERNAAGIFISPAIANIDHEEKLIERIINVEKPMIQISRMFKNNAHQFPIIKADNEEAVFQACEHLNGKGCEKIAFLGGVPSAPLTIERLNGYHRFIKRYQLPDLSLLGRVDKKFGYDNILSFYQQNVTGVVCFNDLVALGAHQRLSQHNINIGRDIKLIGFDNIDDCEFVVPDLTTIDFSTDQLSTLASDAMINWIEKGDKPMMENTINTELILRKSA